MKSYLNEVGVRMVAGASEGAMQALVLICRVGALILAINALVWFFGPVSSDTSALTIEEAVIGGCALIALAIWCRD